jgi:hypothetical protein
MTDHDEQLRNSAAAPAGRPHDELRSSTAEWIRRAMDGIKQMHENEDAPRGGAEASVGTYPPDVIPRSIPSFNP